MSVPTLATAATSADTVGVMTTFTVIYTGRNHPTNVDGVAVGLRLLRDGEYFQFFLPVIPGVQLATTSINFENAKWWSAFVEVGAREVLLRISLEPFEPLEDPTQGVLIPVRFDQVEQQLAGGGGTTELIEGLWAGHPVHEFEKS
jgi:hypothetical protein